MDDTQNKIQDAEIVEEETETPSGTAADQATVLLSLDELIKSHIASIDKLREELTQQRQMLEDAFVNNDTYQEHAKKVKEANKIKSETRQQIMKQPAMEVISSKVKGLSADLKEKQVALSEYLQEYQRMSGANEIEGYDGEVREIINTAKLIKKASRGK